MFKLSLLEGIKNIDKNKTMTYLTVLLFAFLFLLQGYTYSYYAVNEMWENLNGHSMLQEYHLYELGCHGAVPIQVMRMFSENIDLETAEYFADLEAAEHITYVGLDDSGFTILDFKGDPQVFATDMSEWEKYPYVRMLEVTPNFHKVENYRVIEGRDFTDEDMVFIEGKPRPVLLGYKYCGVYEVGDILYRDGNNEWGVVTQLEVIGFLAEDTTVMERAGNDIYDLDNYIVYPRYIIPIEEWGNYSEDVLKYAVNTDESYAFNGIKIMFTEEDEEQGLIEWRTAIDNYSSFGQYYTILDTEYTMEKMQSRMESLTSFFAEITGVLMFFSVITVLISIANRVSRNMKDYAIHIAVGATRSSAVWFIISEMSIILVCSTVLGMFATKWMMWYINMPFYFWKFLAVHAITSVIILALSAVITLISIRKYDICTLIK